MVSNALDRSRNTLRLCLSKDDRIWEVNSVIHSRMFGSKSILAVVKYILRIEKSIEALMYNYF